MEGGAPLLSLLFWSVSFLECARGLCAPQISPLDLRLDLQTSMPFQDITHQFDGRKLARDIGVILEAYKDVPFEVVGWAKSVIVEDDLDSEAHVFHVTCFRPITVLEVPLYPIETVAPANSKSSCTMHNIQHAFIFKVQVPPLFLQTKP